MLRPRTLRPKDLLFFARPGKQTLRGAQDDNLVTSDAD
jgi:hypothetical protein